MFALEVKVQDFASNALMGGNWLERDLFSSGMWSLGV